VRTHNKKVRKQLVQPCLFIDWITAEILSYLNFLDLKALRGVSRQFLETIEAHERFKDSQLLVITKDKFALGELEPDFLLDRNLMHLTWLDIRNIQVNVYDVEEEFFHIPSVILNNVKFVSLLSKGLEDDDNTEPGPDRIIRRILGSARQMTHLQLDLRLLMVGLRQVFDSSDDIDENLKNLKTLDILGWSQPFRSTTYWFDDDVEYFYFEFFETNFAQLVSSLQRLESLHLPVFTFSERRELEIQSAVVRLLQRNRESLRELSLHFEMWNDVLPVTLPRLVSLSATVSNAREQDSLKEFLASTNKDSLEELDVVVRGHDDYEFENNLFDAIRQRSPTLKKLHLQAFKFVDEEGNEMSKVDWTFLGEMKYLRDFQLARPRCPVPNWKSYGNLSILLESLPRNQLERLGLRGIGFKSVGFWRDQVSDMEPELPFKLDLFRGFRNLRRLSLRYCPDAVDDDIMRLIVEEMTSLEELQVSHCSRLTNAGIAGTSEDGSDSIRNLQCKWKYK